MVVIPAILHPGSFKSSRRNGHLIRFIPRLIQGALSTDPLGPSQIGQAGYLDRPFFRTPGVLEGEPWNDYASSFIGGGQAATP